MFLRPRRFLPNLSLLLAFDAVMRMGSVTRAAEDIGLTQSTISRLIQTLEQQLGLQLFIRHRKRLIPTEAASRYSRDIQAALDLIQRASMALIANPEGGTLDLAVLPTFGTRWLAPRLPQFLSAHPGVSINLATRFTRFSFEAEPFDAVIFFGQDDWPGAEHLRLFDERLTACASAGLLAQHPVRDPGDMAGLTLLQLPTRPDAWAAWFRGQGAQPPAAPSRMVMDQFSMMIQAAIAGLGVALLPDYLARVEIAEGRLRPLLRPAVEGTGAYWLAWPASRRDHAPLNAFRNWIETLQDS
ncbi:MULTISPECIES: LysR family transcriptional regulator [unclassified Paracoccus (in: a-proteobacteria)]|uniref:LysR family transcriptional regulator n=1 Tax=unclassified Paracoccus (in: a-proteobacteria) TaxID=2688777 RepID=UPI0012B25A6A|nr:MULTISPECIES: LysR family transcriptional regulator [unclassified Paracoccus (in: a-proteobacteria)]UXU74052.1 LysR family transcriptional regulator [Paracoccus sp. SMMA_5]UXU79941.1 LysR family transcriptional regulator [Paracoccus sp. SMMA_5_TC]